MTWTGFCALGTYANSIFTESSNTGYARQSFSFEPPKRGSVQGYGRPVTFTPTAGSTTTFNAYGFFSAVSGGSPVFVYPLASTTNLGVKDPVTLSPYSVSFNLIDDVNASGLSVDPGGAAAIAGTGYSSSLPAVTSGITAFAGGGQTNATLLSTALNRVGTTATAGDSVKLPVSVAGLQVMVANSGANSVNVFPQLGDQINASGVNVAFGIASQKTAVFYCVVAGTWHSLLSV